MVGFAFTQLALYDKVFAVDNCHFFAPLVKIAQGPEMCSSVTFPKCFGRKLAEELVIEGRPVKAERLERHGFLERFANIEDAKKALQNHLAYLDELEWMSYLTARKLFRDPERELLLKANKKAVSYTHLTLPTICSV